MKREVSLKQRNVQYASHSYNKTQHVYLVAMSTVFHVLLFGLKPMNLVPFVEFHLNMFIVQMVKNILE